MADKIVQVDGVGNISFPDSMSDDDIAKVIRQQHPEVGKSYWQNVLGNLPSSALKLLSQTGPRSGLMGEEEYTPEQVANLSKGKPGYEQDWDAIKQFGGHVSDFLKDPLGSIQAAFEKDPLGTIANVAQAGKGLKEIATSAPAKAVASAA